MLSLLLFNDNPEMSYSKSGAYYFWQQLIFLIRLVCENLLVFFYGPKLSSDKNVKLDLLDIRKKAPGLKFDPSSYKNLSKMLLVSFIIAQSGDSPDACQLLNE